MNCYSAFGLKIAERLLLPAIFTVCLLMGAVQEGYGQDRTYLTGQKTGRTNSTLLTSTASLSAPMSSPTLYTPFYYADVNQLTGTTTNSSTAAVGSLLDLAGLLSANAYIQFRNTANQNIPGGTTTYITLNEAPVFSGILSVPLSQQEFIVGTGRSGAGNYTLGGILGPTANENAGSAIANTITELLIDNQGKWYTGITPPSQYNSVRITIQTGNALLSLGDVISANIYNAFIQDEGDDCSVWGKFTTPGEVTGISVNLLNLNEAIANPHHVLMDNNQYAAYSSGTLGLGVANSISQTIVFDHKATSSDGINVKLGLTNSLIGLDILNTEAISISAYDGPGGTPVWEGSLQDVAQLLGLDLLDLINLDGTHGILEFTVNPGAQFDRVKIQFNPSIVNLEVIGDALRVYHVKLAPAAPEITAQPTDEAICTGDNISFTVTVTSAGTISGYQWQYYDGTNWVNAPGASTGATYELINVPHSLDGRVYRVAVTGGQAGCEQTIYSASAELTVEVKPGKPAFSITSN